MVRLKLLVENRYILSASQRQKKRRQFEKTFQQQEGHYSGKHYREISVWRKGRWATLSKHTQPSILGTLRSFRQSIHLAGMQPQVPSCVLQPDTPSSWKVPVSHACHPQHCNMPARGWLHPWVLRILSVCTVNLTQK